ncbi:MAG: phosphatase PAP2 family protein [Aquificaceae bacterium]
MDLTKVEKFSLNYKLFYVINHRRHPLLDIFYLHFYRLGKGWFALFVGFLFFIFWKASFLKYILVIVFQALVVKLLKYTVRAKRPASLLPQVYLLEDLRLKSFPSGDASMSMAIALCLYGHVPVFLKPIVVLYPILISYGRVYMGAHFPLDVLVGWVIGFLCFYVVSFYF